MSRRCGLRHRASCSLGRIEGARKLGRDWLIPPGAKIEPTGLGRPLTTTEIPRSKASRKKGGKR